MEGSSALYCIGDQPCEEALRVTERANESVNGAGTGVVIQALM